MYIGIVEARRDLDVGDRLAVDEIDDAVLQPQHAIVVECGRRVRHREIEAAGLDQAGRRDAPMRRHHEVAGLLPAAFQDVDFRRPAAVIGEHPERRPYADPDRDLGADFEIAVLLREQALGGQDARDVFVVEQHRLQFRRRAAGDDREHAVADLERIEPERRRAAAGIARIDIDLLLAVPGSSCA